MGDAGLWCPPSLSANTEDFSDLLYTPVAGVIRDHLHPEKVLQIPGIYQPFHHPLINYV